MCLQTEVVVPRALGDGSIIGTTVIQPQHSQTTTATAATIAASRKGILKRTNQDTAATQNNWDYELSPSPMEADQTSKSSTQLCHKDAKDMMQLPMGLPPPPSSGSTAISGTYVVYILVGSFPKILSDAAFLLESQTEID